MLIQRFVRGRLHYGWVVAGVTFLVLLAVNGIRSTPGVLIIPIEQEFGWSRAFVSLAVAINVLLYGLVGPFAAAVMDRFGMRRVLVGALALIVAGVGLMTLIHAPWQIILFWGAFVGLGSGCTANVLAAMVANRWFLERRGQVMGVLTASLSAGRLIFLPVLATLVVAFGWRAAMVVGAAAALLVLPLAAIFMRGEPADVGLRPFGATDDVAPVPKPTGNPFITAIDGLRRCVHNRQFWLLSGSFFICGATTNGLIGTHLVPAAMEHGLSEVTAASTLAVMGIFDVIGITISGWLSDRWDNRRLLCWYYALRGLSLMFLPFALGSDFRSTAAFVVFYGLDWVATVPPTVRLTADLFGKRNVGIVYGWISAGHQLGSATAAFGAGVLRTWLGDYQVAFMSAGLLCLVAAGLVIRINQPSKDEGELAPLPRLKVSASAAS